MGARYRSRKKQSGGAADRPAWQTILTCMVVLALFIVLGFWMNRGIRIEGLYMDDLYMWSTYGEQSFFEFAFPIGTSTRFRPVYWMATYLEMMIIRTHVGWFVPMNILLNVGVAMTVYLFARRLSGNTPLSAICGAMYLVSHFAYYQIGQALGLLETMALWEALIVLWLLYLYVQDGRCGRIVSAVIVFFLLAFTHERYVGLLPLFYAALAFAPRRKTGAGVQDGQGKTENSKRRGGHADTTANADTAAWKTACCWILPLLTFGIIFLIRRFAIGTALPAGTGGTEVTDTFSIGQALRFAVDQVMYLFGINIGPEYLSGRTWSDCAAYVHVLVYCSWIPLALLALSFLYSSVRSGAWKTKRWLGSNLLFLGFIALCIGCSSVTIRVEMRWVYVSYAAALLYAAYMAGVIAETAVCSAGTAAGAAENEKTRNAGRTRNHSHWTQERAAEMQTSESGEQSQQPFAKSRMHQKRAAVQAGLALLMLFYAALLFPAERYYRSWYPQIYFWENQDRMNSLAEQTVLKYGVDGVLGKQVYILGNTYEMSDFYARTFFKVYDPQKTGQGTAIHFIDNLSELPYNADIENTIVLKEVPEARGYQDITDEVFRS